jgi:DNA-binding XRE family transcriptional regulator
LGKNGKRFIALPGVRALTIGESPISTREIGKGYALCKGCLIPDCLFSALSSPQRHQKIIGRMIRKYRTRAGLTQEELAEKADLHPVYIGEIERAEQIASVFALVRIAKALKVRLRDLVAEV